MELRRYWSIVWRYLPIVIGLPLIVGLGSTILFFTHPLSYKATIQLQVVLTPSQANDPNFYTYANYYNFLATEYAIDDLVEVVNGNVFADAVRQTLQGPDFNLPLKVDDVRGAIVARRQHRVLFVDVSTGDRARSMAIARAVGVTLARDPLKYFAKGDLGQNIIPIDDPIVAHSNRVTGAFRVALQTAVALFAGLALAFLLAYLNDRIRDPADVREALALPVLGQLPANGRAPAVAPTQRIA
jgi:capsular polysaccharide biosynthesis protein